MDNVQNKFIEHDTVKNRTEGFRVKSVQDKRKNLLKQKMNYGQILNFSVLQKPRTS